MKFIKLSLFTVSIASLLSVTSCDSSTPAELTDPTLIADNISESQQLLFTGDLIDYTSVTDPEPLVQRLTFATSRFANAFGTPIFIYQKIGRNTFELTADFNAQDNLRGALDLTLSDPSPIGSRIREILLKFDNSTDFTIAELNEIISILNAAGAELSLDPSDSTQLLTASTRRYFHEITSNNADFFAGVQSGNHQVTETSLHVNFRDVSSGDLNSFRLLSLRHKIPFVTNTQVPLNLVEVGRWVLTYINR